MTKISPSLLSADFANLSRDIEMLNESEAAYVHIDVMDGVFVPNISFGFPILHSIRNINRKPLDVHLMIVHPERWVNQVRDTGAEIMNVHLEASTHLHRTVQAIHQAGMKAGVTLNPATPVSLLEDIITDVDIVMLMSVNPGFSGQKFIPGIPEKTRRLRSLIERTGSKAQIEIDGGINLQTGREETLSGADILVAGSFVFNSPDPKATIAALAAL